MPELSMLNSEQIDKIILEQGMSLVSDPYDSIQVDPETAVTIREIEEQLS